MQLERIVTKHNRTYEGVVVEEDRFPDGWVLLSTQTGPIKVPHSDIVRRETFNVDREGRER